jgi:hypothetical protein
MRLVQQVIHSSKTTLAQLVKTAHKQRPCECSFGLSAYPFNIFHGKNRGTIFYFRVFGGIGPEPLLRDGRRARALKMLLEQKLLEEKKRIIFEDTEGKRQNIC